MPAAPEGASATMAPVSWEWASAAPAPMAVMPTRAPAGEPARAVAVRIAFPMVINPSALPNARRQPACRTMRLPTGGSTSIGSVAASSANPAPCAPIPKAAIRKAGRETRTAQ